MTQSPTRMKAPKIFSKEDFYDIEDYYAAKGVFEKWFDENMRVAVEALEKIEDLSPLHERERREISRNALEKIAGKAGQSKERSD